MNLMRPYESIDIETTGLDRQRSEVLEIGIVADLGVGYDIANLPKYNIVVDNPFYEYSESFAMNMNARLIAAQVNQEVQKTKPADAFDIIFKTTQACAKAALKWDNENPNVQWKTEKIQIAGKNASVFDIPVLNQYFIRKGVDPKFLAEWQKFYMHRFIDVGNLFARYFGYVPDMNQVNHITGRGPSRHMGLEDAIDNVCAVRYDMGVNADGTIRQR